MQNTRLSDTFRRLAVLAVAALVTLGAAPPDHQHDFDFEFGAWKATLRMQPHPLSKSNDWITYTGTSVVRKIWDGRANLGELELRSGNKHLEGMSLRIYDRKAHQWSAYFANVESGLNTLPTVGRFENGRGEFYDNEELNGKPVRVRFVFEHITPASFDFVQSFSADGGKTWVPNWFATFTR